MLEACSDDDVRLVGGPSEFEGRVEVCLGGVWRRWCANSGFIKDVEATVVCRQLQDNNTEGLIYT